MKNPVMFVVYVGSIVATALGIQALRGDGGGGVVALLTGQCGRTLGGRGSFIEATVFRLGDGEGVEQGYGVGAQRETAARDLFREPAVAQRVLPRGGE